MLESIYIKNMILSNSTMKTTVIGAFPKPDFFNLPNWFDQDMNSCDVHAHNEFISHDNEKLQNKAIEHVVDIQSNIGIDVITDGEISRENYIYYHCRHIGGFDFMNLKNKTMRQGSWNADVPVIKSKIINLGSDFIISDFNKAQALTSKDIKVTLPGPMTIIDSTYNNYYASEKELAINLAKILKSHINDLINAGCSNIQIDEPVLMRYYDKAIDHGIYALKLIFDDIPKHINTTVHLCCGYPQYLDQESFHKADDTSYPQVLPLLEETGVKYASIEDAQCNHDLSYLANLRNLNIVLGVVAIAKSKLETVDEICSRVDEALKYIDKSKIVLAPDCGLGMLSEDLAIKKLSNMVAAANRY